jgi:hypothetical protein
MAFYQKMLLQPTLFSVLTRFRTFEMTDLKTFKKSEPQSKSVKMNGACLHARKTFLYYKTKSADLFEAGFGNVAHSIRNLEGNQQLPSM